MVRTLKFVVIAWTTFRTLFDGFMIAVIIWRSERKHKWRRDYVNIVDIRTPPMTFLSTLSTVSVALKVLEAFPVVPRVRVFPKKDSPARARVIVFE